MITNNRMMDRNDDWYEETSARSCATDDSAVSLNERRGFECASPSVSDLLCLCGGNFIKRAIP